jgi:hypothetical protein
MTTAAALTKTETGQANRETAYADWCAIRNMCDSYQDALNRIDTPAGDEAGAKLLEARMALTEQMNVVAELLSQHDRKIAG